MLTCTVPCLLVGNANIHTDDGLVVQGERVARAIAFEMMARDVMALRKLAGDDPVLVVWGEAMRETMAPYFSAEFREMMHFTAHPGTAFCSYDTPLCLVCGDACTASIFSRPRPSRTYNTPYNPRGRYAMVEELEN